jgi:hypothetical protein
MGIWYLDKNDNWEPSLVLDFLRDPEISILKVNPDQEDNKKERKHSIDHRTARDNPPFERKTPYSAGRGLRVKMHR